jgi:hypothetical protein
MGKGVEFIYFLTIKQITKMKRILLIISLLAFCMKPSFAQNPEYVKVMEEVVTNVQSAKFGEDLTSFANQFERIASAETKEWLPNYWGAYCYMMKSYSEQNSAKKDILLEKAEALIANADKLLPKNDEIEVMKANIANARMAVDPQSRWQEYGQISATALQNATKINAENPRAKLLQAQTVFYTPEAFGGGKKKAEPVLQEAVEKFGKFKPSSTIMPNWGEATAKYMLSQI